MRWPENLLHFIWRYKLFDATSLVTQQGEDLRILNFGQYNNNAGSDFEQAKIELGNSIWVGNIEIHVDANDWNLHNHQYDKRYNSTILHVIWTDNQDKLIKRQDGSEIPTLVLAKYVNESLLEKYSTLMKNEAFIPCQNHLQFVSPLVIKNWLDRVVIERLAFKCIQIEEWLLASQYDWEKVTLVAMARAFGMKVNSEAFEFLIQNIPTNLLYKYANEPLKINAILFGCAGFLEDSVVDEYLDMLRCEFDYLKRIHNLRIMPSNNWKFMRMRPYNFPTYRLAQFVALFCYHQKWFNWLQTCDPQELYSEFEKIKLHDYWTNHFRFGKVSSLHNVGGFTHEFVNHLLINAFIPVLFAYSQYVNNVDLQSKSLDILAILKSENNNIIRNYKNVGLDASSACDSQALLHLHRFYCSQKKCLDCAIGYSILKR